MKTIADFLERAGGHVALLFLLSLVLIPLVIYFPDNKIISTTFELTIGGLLLVLKVPQKTENTSNEKETPSNGNKLIGS